MMYDCSKCLARQSCIAAAQPGSVYCAIKLMQTGASKADMEPIEPKPLPTYCPYCGKPLRVIGSERFCNNPRCLNRYQPMGR